VEPAHNTTKILAPTHSEVVNLTGFAEHRGLNLSSGKRCLQQLKGTMLAESKQNMIAVDEFISVKERIGIHSSLEVSLRKDK
jgi:hypothetical protein